jgi:putative ABC transport system ATP-binding protein
MMPSLIQTDGLTKTYKLGEVTVNALQGVTLTIERGSFVAIMGASGSGKSTLMNLLGCLDRPTSGRYLLDGVPVEGLDRDQLAEIRNQKIGFVFQNFNLLPRMSAMENVQLPLLYSSRPEKDAEDRAMHVLALVGLAGREQSLPTQLSGGQQQRIAIARALINEPEILLADEPTGQLDSHTSADIMGIFQQLNLTHALTIIVVTHADEVARFANRIITFRDGRIVEDRSGAISHAVAGVGISAYAPAEVSP